MKKSLLVVLSAGSLFFASCDGKDPVDPNPSNELVLKGDIGTRTLDANKKYILEGFVYVLDGETLTIPAGTVIVGDKETKGTLIIARGGKIMAEGTANDPIVFTSEEAPGSRREGDWGGVIILGRAPINTSGGTARIEGGLVPTEAGQEAKYNEYGGTDANDNSGVFKYVRIEFAGMAFTPDNEINSLTMGGVGAGTTISHVQVYRAGDDAFEWFGGTVNCDHLVASYTLDDDFDTDFGYSGKVQFGLAARHKTKADISGSNGFESDNDGNGSANNPQTKAIFSNMTIVGPSETVSQSQTFPFQNGAQIRRNSSMSLVNSVVTGFPIGLYIDDSKGQPTSANAIAGNLMVKNNIFAGNGTTLRAANTAMLATLTPWFEASGNSSYPNIDTTVMFADPYKYSPALSSGSSAGVPSFLLKTGSLALTGADFTGLSGFQNVPYRGAFDGSNNWMAGWTNWNPEATTY